MIRAARIPALWAAVALGACGSAPLPQAGPLVERSAAAMRHVRSVSFELEVGGDVGALGVRSATGVLTSDGKASGSVLLESGGTLIEYRLVLIGASAYIKGPTGGFQRISAEAAGLYDPRELLDPQRGVAGTLEMADGARVEGREEVGGAGAYRLVATIPTDLVFRFLTLAPGQERARATLWVGDDRPYLLRVRLPVRLAGMAEPNTLTVTLSGFDRPVEVTPPPTS